MRHFTQNEAMFVGYLSNKAGIHLGDLSKISIFVVDEEYGSLRSSNLTKGDRVKSKAECQFDDEDGVPVCVILLLTAAEKFGELVFWKGDGTPILKLPDDECSLHSFRKISPSSQPSSK